MAAHIPLNLPGGGLGLVGLLGGVTGSSIGALFCLGITGVGALDCSLCCHWLIGVFVGACSIGEVGGTGDTAGTCPWGNGDTGGTAGGTA